MNETTLTEPNAAAADDHCDGVLTRPPGQLHDLPAEFRWEATRRHPYYVVFWSNAARYRQQHDHPQERADTLLCYAAFLMLGAIGVSGEPVDPRTCFEDLDADQGLDPAFLSGAVQPLTLRAMAITLINALPHAELQVLGAHFMTAVDSDCAAEGDDSDGWQQRVRAMSRLAQLSSPALDSYPDAPLYHFHMGASQRTIVSDVEQQIRRWKQRRAIPERRVHTGKLARNLEVWDLREGWTGCGYDRAREWTLREISQQLRIPISTVASRYQSAFQMITGHEFRPALWGRLYAPLKMSEVFNDPATILSTPMRRRLASPVRRPVPETTLNPREMGARDAGVVESENVICDDHRLTEFLIDLQELLERGLSESEIAERLECEVEAIRYMRDRFTEFQDNDSPQDETADT